jgi:dTDP-4-amino-4,6-dideoxygalactose transaminase
MEAYKQLEKKYSKFVGSKYAVSCNSGTSALHLALMAVGVGKGDEVIVPDFTMAACGFAVSYTGATPVFVDCDDTLCIDPKLIEEKITKRTKVIMAVHIYGRLCQMDKILKIAKKHHLRVIEDACEAQGAVYKSKADITCYSFYQNKIIHAEEGGIATTDNKKYADKMRYLKNMAFDKGHTFFHKDIGYNYRMPESQAKLALESLKNVKEELKERRFAEQNLECFLPSGMPRRDVVWVYDFIRKIPKGFKEKYKDDLRPFFKPLSSFPMYGNHCISPNALKYSKLGNYIKLK